MTETLGTQNAPVDDASATWYRILGKVGLVYIYSRLCVLAGAAIVAAELRSDINQVKGIPDVPFADPHIAGRPIPTSALAPMLDVLSSWDGVWYLRIVRIGYPRHVQADVTYFVADARAAFFPAYPMLVRAVDRLLPGGDTTAALSTNFVLGAIAIFLLGVLARHLYGEQVAAKAMVLGAMFPGSFVLSFAYTEALLLVFAMGCLWCLLTERWVAAGLLAALGTATRPNGLALVLACAVAAVIAIRRERAWRSLAAPLLAPLGFVAFQLWLGRHTGEAGVWFRVQSEAWGEGASYGLTAIRKTFEAFSSPLTSPTNIITAASVLSMALMVYFAWRKRLPLPMVAYCAGILALMLLPNTATARPRFLYTAFPLFISAAAFLHSVRRDWWPYVIGACSAGLVALTALYGGFGAIP
ncbi:MAG: glycosyltransferase family 39 protein [Actinomycetota bacterium]|nr:glycosyltransferase family 39 protein [Actinomycetota bacterium]